MEVGLNQNLGVTLSQQMSYLSLETRVKHFQECVEMNGTNSMKMNSQKGMSSSHSFLTVMLFADTSLNIPIEHGQ